jgi:hypothetical protein
VSEIDEIKSGLSTLSNYASVVGEAFLHTHGQIQNYERNESAIKALRKKNLVHLCSNSDDVTLVKSVKEVIGKVLSRYKTKDASAEVQYLWDCLEEGVQRYHDQLPIAGIRDIESLKAEIEGLVWELSDSLVQSTADFAYLINDGCRKYDSLDLRLRENERILKQANKLNNLIIGFNLDEIDKMARFDAQITRWLGELIINIKQCRKDLDHSLTLLNAILNELREDVKYARLISRFNRAFDSETGLKLAVDNYNSLPTVANVAQGLACEPSVDISNILHYELISKLCQDIRRVEKEKEAISREMPKSNTGISINESKLEFHESVIIARDAFDAVIERGVKLSASQLFDELDFDIDYDIWIFVLLGAIDGRSQHLKDKIKLEYDAVVDKNFNGNKWIRDVTLSKIEEGL